MTVAQSSCGLCRTYRSGSATQIIVPILDGVAFHLFASNACAQPEQITFSDFRSFRRRIQSVYGVRPASRNLEMMVQNRYVRDNSPHLFVR